VTDRLLDVAIGAVIVVGWVFGAALLGLVWFVVGAILAYDNIYLSGRTLWVGYLSSLFLCSIPVLWSLSLIVFGERRHA
jgi:hypothetical protein